MLIHSDNDAILIFPSADGPRNCKFTIVYRNYVNLNNNENNENKVDTRFSVLLEQDK